MLIEKYFNAIKDIKIQKQFFNNEIEFKKILINIEEKNIFIKCLLSSETLYQQELLRLIDRSIAESIIP